MLDAVRVGLLATGDGDCDLREDQQCGYHAGFVTRAAGLVRAEIRAWLFVDQALEIVRIPRRRLRLCRRAYGGNLRGGDRGRRVAPAGALVGDDCRDLSVGQLIAERRHRIVERRVLDRDRALRAVQYDPDRDLGIVQQPLGTSERRIRAGHAEPCRLVTGRASGEQFGAVGSGSRTAGRDRSAGNDGLGRVEEHDAGRLVGGDRVSVGVAAVSAATGGESDQGGACREGRERSDVKVDASAVHRLKISWSLLSDQVGEGDPDVGAGRGVGAIAAGGGAGELGVGDGEGAVEDAGAGSGDDEGEVCTGIRGFTGDTAGVDGLAGGVGEGEGAGEVLAELGEGHGDRQRRWGDDVGIGERVCEGCRAGVGGVVEGLVEAGDGGTGAGGEGEDRGEG